MITISAFADEIGPDLDLQMDTCEANGVKCIDVRGIDGVNVSKMTLKQASEYKKRLDDRGFRVPCIGSPLGKIRMDEDFNAHLELARHCCEVAHRFGTPLVRVFSFYPSQGANVSDEREAVMDHLAALIALAEQCGCIFLHENEKAIYGAKPDGVKDIFATIRSDRLQGVFDPANYVEEGIRPYEEAWQAGLADLTHYFHVKDKSIALDRCVPAGEGDGQFREIFADLGQRNWSGVMTLEPHLQVAGQFSGVTGPELFGTAVAALRKLCDEVGLPYQ